MQKSKIGPYFTLETEINARWIQDLNVSPENIKLLEENRGESSLTLVSAMNFKFDTKCTGSKSKSEQHKQQQLLQTYKWPSDIRKDAQHYQPLQNANQNHNEI